MKKFKRLSAVLLSLAMGVCSLSAVSGSYTTTAAENSGSGTIEKLNRGISAINTGNGMLVSWRCNADDPSNATYLLYKGDELIYTSDPGKATCYLDAQGNAASEYRVDTVKRGEVVSTEKCSLISDNSWLDIPLDIPKGGSDYSYTPNDCSVGDVDGDGTYEIFLKWDPSNSKDNSQWGVTGNVYIDCYRLNGEKLWRIDLGKNIRAGAHYTQFLVADFDLDGKAEMTCKTADGTVDGKGKVIGDGSKDYRNNGGYILDGPEYYTLFDGETGAALDTVNYEYPRGVATGNEAKKTWGDNYGNRCDRFLGAVMYCDGVKPSAVSVRGYYTRMTAVAYDVVNKKLVKRWGFDTGFNSSAPGYGDGNHNCMCADVDNDGKQELVLGATCLDDNGRVLWCNEKAHGDAMHLSDFLPDRPGLELWVCHEDAPYGVSLIDPATGKDIFHFDADKDTGRCCAGNIYAGNPGAEFWGARPAGVVLDGSGQATGIKVPAMNFLIYWDGDLEREILDNIYISKINEDKGIDVILEAKGCASCNSTKATPNLSADIFGDWREELILRTEDSKYLRIFCTPYETDIRLTTLMHDQQYRTQVAGQQTSYNQPPHLSYYLGSDKPLPEPVFDYHTGDNDEYTPGDLNHDGSVDVYDLFIFKKHMNKAILNREDKHRADLNADGKADEADLEALQKYIVMSEDLPMVTEKKSFTYAIDSKWTDGVTEKTNAGFMDEAYINLDNKVGSSIEWTVFVPTAGKYTCTFGIANGSDANRSMQIQVNDSDDTVTQDFLTTGAWTTWEERSVELSLDEGINKIKMTSLTEQGGPNFDYLKISFK